jgi:hypothetical protein
MEGVLVEDHLGLQFAPRARWHAWRRSAEARDREVFTAVNDKYREVKLASPEKKALRREAIFTAWGAEVEGDIGWIGPPLSKLVRLAHTTLQVVGWGVASEEVLSSLLGLWAFVLSFRRPLFAIFQHVYHIGPPEGARPSDPFRLPREPLEELFLVSALVPAVLVDIPAPMDPMIYSIDASPGGAGACACYVDDQAAELLLQHGNHRGQRQALLSPAAATLHAQAVAAGVGSDEEEDEGGGYMKMLSW